MDKTMIEEQIIERKERDYTDKKFSTFYDSEIDVLQICFYSKGCRFNKSGGCIMCDYGKFRRENLKPEEIREIVQKIFKNLDKKPKSLLLNSLGSILDEEEMPNENIIVLLDEIAKIDVKIIIFETHYLTINRNILQLIKDKLPNKEIDIELGFESCNPYYREEYLNKKINNDKFIEKINLIKSFNFSVEINVIFGMPFLSTEEQIEDTVQSIIWCFKNNADLVNIFPINIKPYTVLYKLYETGKYFAIKHKDFIQVLKRIPDEYMDKIYLCWYGNREIDYDGKKTILPICAPNEIDKIMSFYKNFNSNEDVKYRKNIIRTIENIG